MRSLGRNRLQTLLSMAKPTSNSNHDYNSSSKENKYHHPLAVTSSHSTSGSSSTSNQHDRYSSTASGVMGSRSVHHRSNSLSGLTPHLAVHSTRSKGKPKARSSDPDDERVYRTLPSPSARHIASENNEDYGDDQWRHPHEVEEESTGLLHPQDRNRPNSKKNGKIDKQSQRGKRGCGSSKDSDCTGNFARFFRGGGYDKSRTIPINPSGETHILRLFPLDPASYVC